MPTEISSIPAEALGQGSSIGLEIVDSDTDLYYHMAWTMAETLQRHNAAGRPTVFIVPVGPVGQYRRFAWICNRNGISCRDLYLFNMDEYLDDFGGWICNSHPLSFRGFMQREFYEHLKPELRPPADHIIFPDPHDLQAAAEHMVALGGVEIAFGGVGINGHIAFNEPPEPEVAMSNDEFRQLPTRVLCLSRETRTINAHTVACGDIEAIPHWAVTLGMKEICSAKQLRFYMNRPWQRALVRKILHGPVTPRLPASFLQEHPDARLIITAEVAQPPVLRLA
ncbi:MAG: glucosamine-6-phosphate isomerase [Anaerolineae bacterium]